MAKQSLLELVISHTLDFLEDMLVMLFKKEHCQRSCTIVYQMWFRSYYKCEVVDDYCIEAIKHHSDPHPDTKYGEKFFGSYIGYGDGRVILFSFQLTLAVWKAKGTEAGRKVARVIKSREMASCIQEHTALTRKG